MSGKVSKYSAEYNGQLKVAILDVLSEATESITTSDIQKRSLFCAGATPQKMARVLNELVEMDIVRKAKSKATGRMKYILTSVMKEQGYESDADCEVGHG